LGARHLGAEKCARNWARAIGRERGKDIWAHPAQVQKGAGTERRMTGGRKYQNDP